MLSEKAASPSNSVVDSDIIHIIPNLRGLLRYPDLPFESRDNTRVEKISQLEKYANEVPAGSRGTKEVKRS